VYSPKIREDLVQLLYQLKLRLDKPMTEIVDDILREELAQMSAIFLKDKPEVYHESRATGKRFSTRDD